jgi:tRNA dimethylallyltransferase
LTDASDVVDVLVICGPTASGKSAIALALGEDRPTTIVSADSRQVYRGFDIGTAKPTAEERERVVHCGIDVADPSMRYSAAAWAMAADEWICNAHAAGRLPLVVGGTGLYLRALFEGLFQEPALDAGQRAALAEVLAELSTDRLREWVHRLDPRRAHLGRTQLLRSAEIALLTGRRLSDLHHERPRKPRWRPHYLLVDPGPVLGDRIEYRIDEMFHRGWLDEVRALMQRIPEGAPAWNATGYAVVRRLARGEVTRADAREQILIATRQYAKRQRTWFRHQLPPAVVTPVDASRSDVMQRARAWAQSITA